MTDRDQILTLDDLPPRARDIDAEAAEEIVGGLGTAMPSAKGKASKKTQNTTAKVVDKAKKTNTPAGGDSKSKTQSKQEEKKEQKPDATKPEPKAQKTPAPAAVGAPAKPAR